MILEKSTIPLFQGEEMTQSYIVISALIMSIMLISACALLPDAGLSDEEFAVEAQSACNTLQIELESAKTLEQRSEVFSEVADIMMAFELDPETAPQATLLRDNIAALVDSSLVLNDAVNEAVSEYEWAEYTWMIFGTNISAYSNETGIFGMEILDVDEEIVQDYTDNWNAVSDAAEALGLEGCQLDSDS
jgi:hypothetical protein